MFYPVESLRRGGRFYYCWVADSWPLQFATITHRQLWSQDIREICDDLLQVMSRESGYVSARFSLRLSSQLMRGLVRLYQRKVQVFLGDLCMVNATVIKQTKKRLGHESPQYRREVLPRPAQALPRVEELPENEDKVEERIRASGNVVANIEEITLKEQVIPEIQMPTDGFGEENPDQALQHLLNDRTLEEMLGQTNVSAAQNSYLVALENTSTDKSLQDKSRLGPIDSIQMERISEHDMTLRKSTAVNDVMQIEDIEKDILQITEYPIPEIPVVPPPEKEVIPEAIIEQLEVREPMKEKEPLPELELEELEETERKRKRPRKLIIDKKIKISGNMLRQRLENVAVELRCQDSSDDIVDASHVPVDYYLQRPAAAGWRLGSRISNKLTCMFKRNLGVTGILETDPEIEQMLTAGKGKKRTPIKPLESPPVTVQEIAQITVEPTVPDATITEEYVAANMAECRRSVIVEQMDIADLPTQVLKTESQEHLAQKRRSEIGDIDDFGAKKLSRRCGYTSFKLSLQLAEEEALLIDEQQCTKEKESDKTVAKDIEEAVPEIPQSQTITDQDFQAIPEVDKEKRVSQMLEEVGLADEILAREGKTGSQYKRSKSDDSSETPLGSLDRTAVDLGESEKTTDTQKFLRKEWSTQGTMLKIVRLVNQGIHPLTIRSLLKQGPVLPDHKTIVASRCFTALLKLKQHSFVALEKDPVTFEITNITFGSRLKVK